MIKCNERGFVYDDAGKLWLPPINPKQAEIFSDYHRYLLVHGPRKSSKTWGVIHKVIRHAFENNAMFGIVCKTIKNAKASGVWTLLSNVMLPFWEHGVPKHRWEPWMPEMWRHGCPGFKVVEGPKTTGDTKMSFVRIQNRHGGISEIQCHSLEHDSEVEAKFKGPMYSGFWLSEFDQYLKSRDAFDIFCDALRMPGVPYDQHQIIADCNPPETGPNNWQHDLWFKFLDSVPASDETEEDKTMRANLHRILIMIEDNPQLDPKEKADLYARYKKRVTLFNRFCLGIWEQDITDGFFSDVYDEGIHVLGKTDGPPEERSAIVPTPACKVLLTGWDAGLSKNHSFHVLEKIVNEVPDEKGQPRRLVSFAALDEFVIIATYMSIREFTWECLRKIKFWADWQLKHHNVVVKWRHWSDTDAFERRAAADRTTASIVYEASSGQIELGGAPKYKNSQRERVQLAWQLLYERRLFISAQLIATRTMIGNLREGTGADYIQKSRHKHPFDSLTYPIAAEAPADMIKSAELTTANRSTAGIVVAGV